MQVPLGCLCGIMIPPRLGWRGSIGMERNDEKEHLSFWAPLRAVVGRRSVNLTSHLLARTPTSAAHNGIQDISTKPRTLTRLFQSLSMWISTMTPIRTV